MPYGACQWQRGRGQDYDSSCGILTIPAMYVVPQISHHAKSRAHLPGAPLYTDTYSSGPPTSPPREQSRAGNTISWSAGNPIGSGLNDMVRPEQVNRLQSSWDQTWGADSGAIRAGTTVSLLDLHLKLLLTTLKTGSLKP